MGGEWEKVKGPTTRSKKSEVSHQKSKIPESTKTNRKPLREKNVEANHPQQAKSKTAAVQKTLEECARAIGSGKDLQKEIDGLYERNKDRPNVWLNELVKLIVNSYIELPKDVEKVLVKTLKDDSSKYIKPHTRSTLYHETILSMSEDSARNKPTVGYRVVLQVLAKNFSIDAQKSISDRLYFNASTAHAYRSNPSTCMPLLWAMGAPFLSQPNTLTTDRLKNNLISNLR